MMDRDDFVFWKAFRGWEMHTFLLDRENRMLRHTCKDTVKLADELVNEVRRRWGEEKIPVLYFEDDLIFYMGFEDGEGRLYLFGPISFQILSEAQVTSYKFHHKFGKKDISICCIPLNQAAACLSMVYALATGICIEEEEITRQAGRRMEISQENQWEICSLMADMPYYTYENEKAFLEIFERGGMVIEEKTLSGRLWELELLGPLAARNFLKQCEYMAVMAIYMARRAAAEQGVNAEYCYRQSFCYMQELAECKTSIEMIRLYTKVIKDYGNKISEVKQKKILSGITEQCKAYIARNIKKKIILSEMAEQLGYNASYLSRKFSESEGMTVKQYVLQEKLTLAANMLKNSDVSIGKVSDYFGFHSQSYFSEQFTSKYGMNPKEYRLQNGHHGI